jgi:hypothetical protein
MRQQKGSNSSPPRNVRRQENGRTYKQSFKRQLFVSKWCNGWLFWYWIYCKVGSRLQCILEWWHCVTCHDKVTLSRKCLHNGCSGACVPFFIIWLSEMLLQLNNKMGMENLHLFWDTLLPNFTYNSQTVCFLTCWMMSMAGGASWLLLCIPHLNSGMLQITLGN